MVSLARVVVPGVPSRLAPRRGHSHKPRPQSPEPTGGRASNQV